MLIKLANTEDVPEEGAIIVLGPLGREIALFKIEGEVFALDNACPHQGGPLGEGEIEGYCVTCPWHAWTFDVRNGVCTNIPGDDAISIPIIVQDEQIYIDDNL